MKSSHLTTPRTLNDCAFLPSADPFTYYGPRAKRTPSRGAWAAALCVTLVLIVAYLGR